MTFKTYVKNVLIGIDQLCNTLIKGEPDETISSRVYRNAVKKEPPKWYAQVAMKVIDFIFGLLGDKDHCKASYESEVNRTQINV